MPMMVASAINQVFAMAGGVAFPYAYYLLAFVASTALALIARTLTERFIKISCCCTAPPVSRLLENSLNFFSKRAPGEIFSRFTSWQMAAGQKIELDNGLRTDWVIGAIALAVMCYLSPMLALVPVVGVLLMGRSACGPSTAIGITPSSCRCEARCKMTSSWKPSRVFDHQICRPGRPAAGRVRRTCPLAVQLPAAAKDL